MTTQFPPAGSASAVSLATSVADLPGVGPAYVAKLARLGVATVNDLLHYFPRRYDDLRNVRTLEELGQFGALPPGETVAVEAEVLGVAAQRTRYRRSLVKAQVGSSKGFIEAVWFNQPYLAKTLKPGKRYIFAGKLKDSYGRPSLQNPTFEELIAEQTHTARLVPVYPETEGLSSKWLRSRIKPLLALAGDVAEELPVELRRRYKLLDVTEAIRQIHFPDTPELAERARYRYDFAQIFFIQLAALTSRRLWRQGTTAPTVPYDPGVTKRFVGALPWPLTEAQRRATQEILSDLAGLAPMMRLLEGDVGSGKTAVAAVAAHQVMAAGYQVALLAPTEVLARQHAATLREWFSRLDISVEILLGSMKPADKKAVTDRLQAGQAPFVVGTHALIQEGIQFKNLALAIVDEQHRFGVAQRQTLRGRQTPHLLSMTATPIPRSLALVAFGDQELSVIDELPAGRRPVVTELVLPGQRQRAYQRIRQELSAGRQAFFIYPVIDESERGLKNAVSEFQRLRQSTLADFKVGLLHGRLPTDDKVAIMERFQRGQLDVLVATSVIEVGVDVPNATMMVIEEAQQFGLAQLHQFRGRVGRGSRQAYCYLLAGSLAGVDNERLQAMTEHASGFKLAEIDLELRGPGDLLGTKQSGFDISVAALTNPTLLKQARAAAQEVLQADAELAHHPLLKQRLDQTMQRS